MIVDWFKKKIKNWIKSVVREMFREEMITGGKGTWYIDNDRIGINAAAPYIFLSDTVSGEQIIIQNVDSTLKILNGASGANVLTGDLSAGNVTSSGNLSLSGAINVEGDGSIGGNVSVGGGLSWKGGVLFNKSVTATAGAGAYGASVTISPNSGYNGLIPIAGSIEVASAGTGESITTQITATYSDGTTASITKSVTGNGTIYLGSSDLEELIKDGVYITELLVAAESSATSTTATSTVTIVGIEH